MTEYPNTFRGEGDPASLFYLRGRRQALLGERPCHEWVSLPTRWRAAVLAGYDAGLSEEPSLETAGELCVAIEAETRAIAASWVGDRTTEGAMTKEE
jgi:hypothetical protein